MQIVPIAPLYYKSLNLIPAYILDNFYPSFYDNKNNMIYWIEKTQIRRKRSIPQCKSYWITSQMMRMALQTDGGNPSDCPSLAICTTMMDYMKLGYPSNLTLIVVFNSIFLLFKTVHIWSVLVLWWTVQHDSKVNTCLRCITIIVDLETFFSK